MKSKIGCLFILLASTFVFSQNPATEKYNTESIYLQTDFWGYNYIQNNKKHRVNGVYRTFSPIFSGNDLAMDCLKSYRRNISTAWIFIGAAYACLGGAYYCLLSDNISTSLVFDLSALACVITAIPFSYQANNSLQKAVWEYNRGLTVSSLPFKEETSRLSFAGQQQYNVQCSFGF